MEGMETYIKPIVEVIKYSAEEIMSESNTGGGVVLPDDNWDI